MSFLVNTKYRSEAPEIMDDFNIEGELLRDTLDKLELINRLLGGNKVTVGGVKTLLKHHPKNREITIIDIGCGHGDILRDVARFGRNEGYRFKLIGIDANKDAIAYARELSQEIEEISFKDMDIFSSAYRNLDCDIVLCTLFLHHFPPKDAEKLLKENLEKAQIGIVVNDLHRSRLAYYLFNLITVFAKNRMVREDGLTSILKAFKKRELQDITNKLKAKACIQWKWAFRYQWILTKS